VIGRKRSRGKRDGEEKRREYERNARGVVRGEEVLGRCVYNKGKRGRGVERRRRVEWEKEVEGV